jgi:hypothetical protein
MSLILPPYGRILLAFQEATIRLQFVLYLHVGKNSKEDAYADISMGTFCTFLPYGDDYKKYNWPVQRQNVCVFDSGETEEGLIKKMCLYLFQNFNPRTVQTFSDNPNNGFYLTREKLNE